VETSEKLMVSLGSGLTEKPNWFESVSWAEVIS
jgi:hypothetical protein